MGRITVGTVVMLLTLVPQVLNSGIFELRLSSFTNEEGRLADGGCCGSCPGRCATMFRICLKHYQSNVDLNSPCTFGETWTPVVGNNSIYSFQLSAKGFPDPIRFPFNFTWPGTFSLIVEAWSSNLTSYEDGYDGKTLITRLTVRRWLAVNPEWVDAVYQTNHTRMNYSIRVMCAENYYGEGCEKLCRSRDDKFGHYTCTPSGDKVCMEGWKGNYCAQPICREGCHESQGSCTRPNECKCRMGWQGVLCDQCIRYPGCIHGTCNEPWQCNCDEGWGGLFCNQDLNYCTNNKPCKNGGTCTNTGQGSYTCTCAQGFTGANCDTAMDPCAQQPCRNGATCVNADDSYRCECPLGYSGPTCERVATACADNTCLNKGTCVEEDGGFRCECPPSYKGTFCQIPATFCDSSLCKNGGACSSNGDSIVCDCLPGYKGDFCEHKSQECAVNDCLNDGVCLEEAEASRRCLCVPGYVGALCEVNVDDCLTKPCANGGTCYDLVNDYKCVCQPGFTGKDCSVNINDCSSQPCLNGGTCEDRVMEYLCLCPEGYSGANCELGPPGGDIVSLQHGDSSHQVSEVMTKGQVALIVAISAAVPVLVCVATIVILGYRYKKRREIRRQEEEIRRQNEQNSMNNKYVDKHIYNTLDKPKTLKLTNEETLAYTKDISPIQRTKSDKLLNNAPDRDCVCKHNSTQTRQPTASTSHSERRTQDSSSIYVIELQDPVSHQRLEKVLATQV